MENKALLSLFSILAIFAISSLGIVESSEFNVIKYGAKSDGKTDCTSSFLKAWTSACSSHGSAVIRVPSGRYLLRNIVFEKCRNSDITFSINGTLVAPSDYNVIGHSEQWIKFEDVNGVSIKGGVLDGQGTRLWNCKASSWKNCPQGAASLIFSKSKNIVVQGLASINSQKFHIVISGSENVKVQDVGVTAPGNSPNTDGIHVESSSHVTISRSNIKTGDDCISIGPGSSNLWIERIACGPGHGISIGSLGKEAHEAGVQNVTVKTVAFTGTQNGLRIKTWARASNGFVRNINYLGATMNNVDNPIIIDQQYCPHGGHCPNQGSGVKISRIKYQSIQGTSATQVAVKFDCSIKEPCSGIILQDVNLTYENQPAQSSCESADGSAYGVVKPKSCL
ncbi:hypothetical protein ACHQM5_029514 [Ranunculus cassubicifolius]